MMSTLTEVAGPWVVPLFTICVVLVVQLLFWIPNRSSNATTTSTTSTTPTGIETLSQKMDPLAENVIEQKTNELVSHQISAANNDPVLTDAITTTLVSGEDDKDEKDLFQLNTNNQWRCACNGGFLPPGLLKSFGSAEAVMRLGTGQCYHK